ncbi:MAG TPA: SDR family NAD(P)-dependent oxidoreductase [Myxococcota bacterium]|nr:SDR family NAD(P)-dependent oxidoreductase [Myxococcota bacterium]
MQRFSGKSVLVTGAASGIGRATAERIASEGGALFLADVDAQGLEETAKRARELGADVEVRICDVSDAAAARATVEAAVQRLGKLDSLCNIAGILHFHHTHELPLETWRRILSVNLDGTFFMSQAALPHLLAARGNVVNMASTAGLAGHPWTAAYSASKGGILAFTYTLAIEYCGQGLRANAVCPGSVTTPIHGMFKLPEGADRKLLYRIMPPDRVFRGPEVVASTVAFLASDDAAHINGEAIRVDGGTLS